MPSIEQLQKLLALDPNDAFVLYGLAIEHAKRAETEKAVAFFDRCLAADPHYCYAYYHKARTLESAGRKDEALATLRAGLDAAKAAQDAHALSEIQGFLAELE